MKVLVVMLFKTKKSSTVLNTDYLIYDERYGKGTKKHERALELNGKGKNI